MAHVNFVYNGLCLVLFVKVFTAIGDTQEESQEAREFECSALGGLDFVQVMAYSKALPLMRV